MPIFTDSKYGACIKLPSANSGFLEALYKHHSNKKDGSCDSLVFPPGCISGMRMLCHTITLKPGELLGNGCSVI